MKPVECPFESEVFSAVMQGFWPDRAGAELQGHAAQCSICSDVATVAAPILEAGETTCARVVLPPSGRVWWLAQLRARREAAESANRTIDLGVAAAMAGAAVAAWTLLPLQEWVASLAGKLGWNDVALLVAVAAMLIFIPAAACLALGRE